MERYGCERHTASSVMRKIPVFRVGKRMFVRAKDLIAWEESRMEYPVAAIKRTTATVTKIPRKKAV